ncbi:hypothetical protein MMC18_005336 [Xylographa bjoerkii]|nr:hypothetical protein [Xylographa bjoerkii]
MTRAQMGTFPALSGAAIQTAGCNAGATNIQTLHGLDVLQIIRKGHPLPTSIWALSDTIVTGQTKRTAYQWHHLAANAELRLLNGRAPQTGKHMLLYLPKEADVGQKGYRTTAARKR